MGFLVVTDGIDARLFYGFDIAIKCGVAVAGLLFLAGIEFAIGIVWHLFKVLLRQLPVTKRD
jgi:hypothetical protein